MKKDFLLIIAIYILACTAVMPFVKWYVDNADSFQYLSIAHHILDGHLSVAINGYWGPLISWLLVPFILIFDDGIVAFKYLQIAIGIFVIMKWLSFLVFIDLEIKWKRVLGFAIIPFLISYSLINLTPDLLFVGVLLTFIIELINWLDKKSDGRKIGIIGALLFLTKAFGLPLFIFLFSIAVWMKDERIPKVLLKKILFPFFIIAGSWVLILSVKYGEFTISRSAKFNFTYEVAPTIGKKVQLPVLGNGILKPANEFALSAWEEPSSQVNLTPIDPIHDFKFYLNLLNRNVMSIYYNDFSRQSGALLLILVVLSFFKRKEKQSAPLWIKISWITIASIYFGYSLILVHERYLWITSILFLPMIFYYLFEVFPLSRMKNISEVVIILILVFILKRPAKEVVMCGDRDVNTLQLFHVFRSPIETMEIFYRPDEQLHADIEKLKRVIPKNSNFASIKKSDPERDGYAASLQVAYELHGKYFGQTFDVGSTFKGYLISWKEESGEKVFDSDGGIKVYLQ